MNDPFKIIEPTVISFSGGRTSAYMLWRVLQSNNGLPADAIVCFANTGKEEEATLEFVRDCGKNWGVEIHWIEYRYVKKTLDRWKKVTFETASRNGEPFFELIDQNGSPYLPNPVARICTAKLKIRAIHAYLKSLGWKHNENMDWVGIRADEMRRAAKMDRERTPLVTANVTKQTVGDFWKAQSFDLGLPNMNGVTMHGNCDLCFLKPTHQIISLIKEKPERALWWIKMENHANSSNKTYGNGAKFRKDRPSYQQMYDFATNQTDMFKNIDDFEESIPCFCGD
jgi:3'-phosphoadenosine 5'-phosphosulfate sulfotransferase (PAPS reductase)/FAD synthetase